MGRKRPPGIVKRDGIWHIDKRIGGQRVCQSTGSADLEEAEWFLARLTEESRQALVYGVRPSRTFEKAAAKFVLENQHKRSLKDDIGRLKHLMPWIGDVPLERIHRGTLQPWLEFRQREGVSTGTINHGLKVVRRILNLAAGEWMDEHGLTWLAAVPKIKLLPDTDKRMPYPLSWEEQDRLIKELPGHLQRMALYKVNTGCREQEVCQLRWNWEVKLPELETSVFVLPSNDEFQTKNAQERIVVLNSIAQSIVDEQRGKHPEFVFTYKGNPTGKILNSSWKRARIAAGLPNIRVHDLRHTFGHRLRAAGVGFEDRQDLLGHKSERITTHYSAPDIARLVAAAENVCARRPNTVLRVATHTILTQPLTQNGSNRVDQVQAIEV